MSVRNIALIGYGGTARTVLQELERDPASATRVSHVIVRPGKIAQYRPELPSSVAVVDSLAALPSDVSLVVETAGHSAVAAYGTDVLASGRDLGLISSGALAHDALLEALKRAAQAHGRQLLVFNGAVAAIDAISSAMAAGLRKLCYTGTKPAAAWEGTPAAQSHDLHALREPTVIFEGSAREVAIAYPKNANVGATVALAGLGMDDTRVRLVADPQARVNRHRLEGESVLGKFEFETEALPSPSNPKTSSSTAYSIVAFLRGGPNALRLA